MRNKTYLAASILLSMSLQLFGAVGTAPISGGGGSVTAVTNIIIPQDYVNPGDYLYMTNTLSHIYWGNNYSGEDNMILDMDNNNGCIRIPYAWITNGVILNSLVINTSTISSVAIGTAVFTNKPYVGTERVLAKTATAASMVMTTDGDTNEAWIPIASIATNSPASTNSAIFNATNTFYLGINGSARGVLWQQTTTNSSFFWTADEDPANYVQLMSFSDDTYVYFPQGISTPFIADSTGGVGTNLQILYVDEATGIFWSNAPSGGSGSTNPIVLAPGTLNVSNNATVYGGLTVASTIYATNSVISSVNISAGLTARLGFSGSLGFKRIDDSALGLYSYPGYSNTASFYASNFYGTNGAFTGALTVKGCNVATNQTNFDVVTVGNLQVTTNITGNGGGITNLNLRAVTNYAQDTVLVVDASSDVFMDVTNGLEADFHIVLTNLVVGKSGSVSFSGYNSQRLVSLRRGDEAACTVMSTNVSIPTTNLVIVANKNALLAWTTRRGLAGATNVYYWGIVAP